MTGTNGRRITTHEATIKTAAVEIKTLTISGKQVTLAVFRQLRRDDTLINLQTGTFQGLPWGHVNYHHDCESLSYAHSVGGGSSAHLHVVWQRGVELRHAICYAEPHFYGIYLKPAEAEVIALYRVSTLQEGFCPDWWKPPPYGSYYSDRHRLTHIHRGVKITVNIPEDLQQQWNLQAQVTESPNVQWPSYDAAKERTRQALKENGWTETSATKINERISAAVEDYFKGQAAYMRRYQELQQLDQLFIAV
jgi:hypothetical protein